ncbi:MAG: kelch repeat-containing protein [Thermoplasmatota archaeon]
MRNQLPNRSRSLMILFLAVLLALNLQVFIPAAEGTDVSDEIDGESRLLTDEEISRLGLGLPGDEMTRSEPWKIWERYHYPSGGEDGATVYYAPENRIYIYGGGYPGQWDRLYGYDELFYYDITNNTWNAIERSNKPDGRGYFGDAVDNVNHRLYIYGGYYSDSMMDDLWVFDVITEQWTKLNFNLEPGVPRRARVPMVIDTTTSPPSLYLHMGQGDSTQNNANLSGFYRIDLTEPNPSVTALNDGISDGILKRYGHDMCIDEANKKIYMYGGNNDEIGYLTEFWVYDIVTDQWQFIPTHPDMNRLYGSRMFYRASDGTVNLWGGLISGSTESDLLWTYDTVLGTWSSRSFIDVPEARLMYANHYSPEADRFVVFAGRYYGWGGQSDRYRDLNYLDLGTMDWTSVPETYSPNSRDNAILAFDSDRQRIYYIGPNTANNNGTAYFYYWDIVNKQWIGPIYNPGGENPQSRSNAGLCLDAKNKTVYMYGGGYTTGQGPNTRYYDLADVWKVDLVTNVWTNIMGSAGPQERQGFPMIFNENDGKIYLYGGYYHPSSTSRNIEIRDDFFRYDPISGIFQPLSISGSNLNGRYGSGMVLDTENNHLYIYGGTENTSPDPTERRDLWRYDARYGTWTELAQTSSARMYAKLAYDPLTKEIYMTGGENDDLLRYRMLEDKWYSDWYPVPNPGTLNEHAQYFDPVSRDLWIYGGGARSGIWRLGIPPRLVIQTVDFEDPDQGENNAYAMYRPYTFSTSVIMVNGPEDLSRIEFELPHRQGTFKLTYNHTVAESGGNGWTEIDTLDVAEVVGTPSVTWRQRIIDIEFKVKFHWNWTNRPNAVDRTIKVKAIGIGVSEDELIVRNFLFVRNTLKFRGRIELYGSIQGPIKDKDWVQTEEEIRVWGPTITFSDNDQIFPPADSLSVDFWVEKEKVGSLETTPGQPINYTYLSPNVSGYDITYTINISGVNDITGEEKLVWNLSVDGVAPDAPLNLRFYDEDPEATPVVYDNDLHVFLAWQAPREDLSGIKTYYWDYEDGGGTQNGLPVNTTHLELTLEGPGEYTIYIWTEDEVGNIGPAASSKILIDMEGIVFRIVSPDFNKTIPYETLDVIVNITDFGGSRIVSQSIQYRYTYDGQGDDLWIGQDAWKYLPDLWTSFQKNSYQFTISIGKGGIPKLSDSDENYLQIRARDGAGTNYNSPLYNINVDTSLRFPEVNLTGPLDGSEFDDPEDVRLEWDVDFFAPEDVVYRVYISEVKAQVELWDDSIKVDVFDTYYEPDFLTFGRYYWTVIPVAKNQWVGSCVSGIWQFRLTDESSYQFSATTDEDRIHKYRQGAAGIPITFQITNNAKLDAWILPTSDLAGVATIYWQALDTEEQKYRVMSGESKEVTGLLNILSDAPVETYEFDFYFVNQWGINHTVTISVDVLIKESPDDDDDDGGLDIGVLIGFVIIGIIFLMLIISALYFLVLKKRKKGHKASEEHLARIEEEMIAGEKPLGSGLAMAPQPKGLGKTRGGKLPKEGEDIPEMEEWSEEETVEEIKLVEEGSEDDWMNLVAAETFAEETESKIVEDKTVRSDKNKSLKDLLSEMSDDEEN